MNLENFSIKDKITQCYLEGMTQQEAMDTTGKTSGYVSKVYSNCTYNGIKQKSRIVVPEEFIKKNNCQFSLSTENEEIIRLAVKLNFIKFDNLTNNYKTI